MTSDRGKLAFAGAWLVVCLLLIYAGSAGLGFVKDDFGWVLHSRITRPSDIVGYVTDPQSGFFRPLVALSFGLSELAFGVSPKPYGLTNLALVVAIALAIARLGTSLGSAAGAALFGGAVWALNFHGIGMGVLWISGRTSLLLTLFAVLAATAFARRQPVRAGLFMLCALLCKEEPVALPFVFGIWAVLDARSARWTTTEVLRVAFPLAALVLYLVLRASTSAMTPGTAPDVYALTTSPGALASNAVSYADRTLTFGVAVLLLGVLLFARAMPRLTPIERTTFAKGTVWIAGGFAVTIMLPIRSSLYAVFPSVGAALIAMAIGEAIWRSIPDRRRTMAFGALLALPLLCLPIYWTRNTRLADEARLSANTMARMGAVLHERPHLELVLIHDNPAARPSINSAFAAALPDAVRLVTGREIDVHVLPDAGQFTSRREPSAADAGAAHFVLDGTDVAYLDEPAAR